MGERVVIKEGRTYVVQSKICKLKLDFISMDLNKVCFSILSVLTKI